jgi:cytochrome c peroxidase
MSASPSLVTIVIALLATSALGPANAEDDDLADLGGLLFFDANLSAQRNQSCSSCHDPLRAFTEARDNGVAGAVSVGDDGKSLGDRNAPTLSYAALTPSFHQDENGNYVGGFFVDGRATTLVKQAQEPILNPIEMALPDAAVVRDRVQENAGYVTMFETRLGPNSYCRIRKHCRVLPVRLEIRSLPARGS